MKITLWEWDYKALEEEGWEVGELESGAGWHGYAIRHAAHHPEWVDTRATPCSADSIADEDGWVGPSGAKESATEAVMDRIRIAQGG